MRFLGFTLTRGLGPTLWLQNSYLMEERMRQRTKFLKASAFHSRSQTPLDSFYSLKSREDTCPLASGPSGCWPAWVKDFDHHRRGLHQVQLLWRFWFTSKWLGRTPRSFPRDSQIGHGTESCSLQRLTGWNQPSKRKVLTYPEPKANLLDDLGKPLNFSGP